MLWLLVGLAVAWAAPVHAAILWSDLGATLAHETGPGADILGGAAKRDDSAGDTLYFKFHVDPLSDVSTEEYFAAFQLFEGDTERLAIGNSLKAWAYSAFNTVQTGEFNEVFGDLDLNSARPELVLQGVVRPYELPRKSLGCTIIFRVDYVPGDDDNVTAWMHPDLSPGMTEASQLPQLTTRFKANASFDQIRLRHGGGGSGWTFSELAIATSFEDFVNVSSPESEIGAGETGARVSSLTFRAWQREEGLPHNSVNGLVQTRDGYLWVGCDAGVARFDGTRFVSFALRDGLRSERVSRLFEDSRGALWLGTAGGGLTRMADGEFRHLTMRDGLPSDSITALAEDAAGRLWVGTDSGVAVCDGDKLAVLNCPEEFAGRFVTTIVRDRNGAMWLGATGYGVFQFVAGKSLALTDASLGELLLDPHYLLFDRAGRIWLGAGDDYLLCREQGEWRRFRIPRHLATSHISALAEAPDGTVWAGSVSEGLFQFRDGKLSSITAASGLSDNFVRCLQVDREGNLWVGTSSGLNRLRRTNLSMIDQSKGLGYGPVHGLLEVAPGAVLAAKPADGIYRWNGLAFNRWSEDAMLGRRAEMNCLLKTRDGSLWAGGIRGLARLKAPESGGATEEQSLLAGKNVTSLAEDSDGNVWAGTYEGELWRHRAGQWTLQNYSPNVADRAITAIAEDLERTVWIATAGGGLHWLRSGTWTPLGKPDGLLSDSIRTLHPDGQGAMWIGTDGGGLSRWRRGSLNTFTTQEGLPDNTISQIVEDDFGRLWLGTSRGIAGVRKHDLNLVANGKAARVSPQLYGRADGMSSEECTGGFFPAALKDASGLLWFPTAKGIAIIDPVPGKEPSFSPAVTIEEILLDGEPVRRAGGMASQKINAANAQADALEIPPGRHRLELRFTGISLGGAERMRFRYRLEGLDADWVDAGAQRTAIYNYIPPGRYQFIVTACDNEGVWNENGARLGIRALPHFWQRWWFIPLVAVAVLGTVAGGVRGVEKRQTQRRLRYLEQQRALEKERARIAQDLHDDLGSSLARISLLSSLAVADKDSPAQVELHVSKIAQSANDTVRALEEIVWAVRPGSDSLQSLLDYIVHFATELFEGNGVRCRLDLPPELPARSLPPEIRHNIFLVVKEALANVVKHANAREVSVQARASARSLEILVHDDGKGFDVDSQATGRRNGLGNMRHRAQSIGGTLAVQSAPGSGTIVHLTVNFDVDVQP